MRKSLLAVHTHQSLVLWRIEAVDIEYTNELIHIVDCGLDGGFVLDVVDAGDGQLLAFVVETDWIVVHQLVRFAWRSGRVVDDMHADYVVVAEAGLTESLRHFEDSDARSLSESAWR